MRQATAADHDAVEGAIPLMDAGLTRERYIAVLQRIHGVVKVWEEFALAAAPPSLRPLLEARQRKALLEADLKALQASIPTQSGPNLPEWRSEAELLGAMYVIEGSRLGGQMIARHIHDLLGIRSAFFLGFEGKTAAMWKELLSVLADEPDEEAVIRAARQMFGVFGGWMRGAWIPRP